MSYVLTERWGLGDMQTANAGVAIGSTVLSGGAAALSVGGASSILAGLVGTAAVPFIGPAIAAASLIAAVLVKNSGCGVTCVETSQWANEGAAALQKNLDQYFSLPTPRPASVNQVFQNNFQQIWAALQQSCGQPGTGNAGVRCITDRQRGACTWKQTGQPQYPGQPLPGACFDWFQAYLDPIALDPNVSPDSSFQMAASSASSVGSDLSSLFTGSAPTSSSGLPSWLGWVAAGLVGLFVLQEVL